MSLRFDLSSFLLVLLTGTSYLTFPVYSAKESTFQQASPVGTTDSALVKEPWHAKVLVTNDDGIDAPGLRALVRAFSGSIEVVVVAPAINRSGSTSFASILSGPVTVETVAVQGAKTAYAVTGYPADCVLIAVTGLMKDDPPDLVVSGINSGANVADTWAYSGTLGAARIAALHGIPAIAVSGGGADSLEAIATWVVQLAGSSFVRDLPSFDYLTVDAPDIPLADIKGVQIVPRARGIIRFGAQLQRTDPDGSEIWVRAFGGRQSPPSGTDAAAVRNGFIALTTMQADEQNLPALRQLQERAAELPLWNAE